MNPKVKCLLVDDLEENLLALSALLRADDVELYQARSGAAALELLLQHDFALALLDVQMPEMDGFELAELMRGTAKTAHVPIIFVTAANKDRERVFKGYEAGAVDFLYKPIEPQVLKSKAGVFFQLYRQKAQLNEQVGKLAETLRLTEMFTAILGHDLRNPLSAIVTTAQTAERRSYDEATKRSMVRIQSSAHRMSRLIDGLLDLSRARLSGGIPLTRSPCDLGHVLQQVMHEHDAHPETRLSVQMKGELVGAWDPDRMSQVLSNLVGNAVSHGTPGAPIGIVADGSASAQVTLEVTNQGTVPEDLKASLFDPFRGSRGGDGLGLGLYIVSEIVRAHGGTIACVSEDGSTTFRLVLPR